MSAQVQFIESGLKLIHIPLKLYPHFLRPILQLLFLSEDDEGHRLSHDQHQKEPWASRHRFLNISVTSLECSIVCSRQNADELFDPLVRELKSAREQACITVDDYVVIQVDGEGLDAGRRVVELTSPLALAGISIFFITTYFADYILVPAKSRDQVVAALEERGFVLEKHTDAFVNHHHHQRNQSSGSSVDSPSETPPPADLNDLQSRTFSLLERQNIIPTVDRSIRLILCAGRKDTGQDGRSAHGLQLQLGLVKCFVRQPHFLSLTLTDTEPASLLVEKRLLPFFRSTDDVLLGTRQDVLIPITLDLRDLPLESTGIVCGVAGRLVGAATTTITAAAAATATVDPSISSSATSRYDDHDNANTNATTYPTSNRSPPPAATTIVVDMSYLSTARAGTVMVGEEELDKAVDALRLF